MLAMFSNACYIKMQPWEFRNMFSIDKWLSNILLKIIKSRRRKRLKIIKRGVLIHFCNS